MRGNTSRAKSADAPHGFVVFQKSRLAHVEQVAEAADVIVNRANLFHHLIGRAGHHDAGLDRALDRCRDCETR